MELHKLLWAAPWQAPRSFLLHKPLGAALGKPLAASSYLLERGHQTRRVQRRWGGSTQTTPLLSVWGCEWGPTPLSSYTLHTSSRRGRVCISLPGENTGLALELELVAGNKTLRNYSPVWLGRTSSQVIGPDRPDPGHRTTSSLEPTRPGMLARQGVFGCTDLLAEPGILRTRAGV
jgi:hypothetical protein